MSKLPEYQPNNFEPVLVQEDIAECRFHSVVDPNKTPYTIVMPPPNVTGMLHMGHILNNTIQDVLIRFKRMDGFEACWIPGLDHASIATESKVTSWLSEQHIDKRTVGREKFLEYAMEWKERYGGIITTQLKRLGVSCDWSRERFTMDKEYSVEVLKAFVELYHQGLIYKGMRMVNWCPVSRSAISDEEVEHIEEAGSLWKFSYPIKDSKETITIATTRPETMFGDSAVMVHPEDVRYKHLIGKYVVLPFVNKEIPIIADEYVDREFGTGAVKVTPAHDPNDYQIGIRHKLEMPIVMTEQGTMADNVPEMFIGLDRFEARTSVVAEMQKLGLLAGVEAHQHKVGYSQRGKVPIEFMISEQWFMSMKTLAEPARQVVDQEQIKFYPSHWKKTYFFWLDNIKDWCISRQLWWGHRIPVYNCGSCDFLDASVEEISTCPKCGSGIRQDESVLDTWASSWLWSYAVHKDPREISYYHPTDTLVTGPDIIFFWVARMIMAAQHFHKEIPFRNVYFTGIIRDDLGRKMSKSLGNSPDPMDVMEQYGADALRFSIIRLAPLGNDILYSSEKVDLGRRFANKIWNAARFIQMHIENNNLDINTINTDNIELELDDFDKSILTRFNFTIQQIRDHFDKFRINDVAREIYDFIWGDFCDRFIESSKYALAGEDKTERIRKLTFGLIMLKKILKMLHPVMPFITEKLFREIFGSQHICFEEYPKFEAKECFEEENRYMERLEQSLYIIREIRAQSNVPVSAEPSVEILVNKELRIFFEKNAPVVSKLAKLSRIDISSENREPRQSESVGTEFDFQVFVNLEGIIDKDKEIERLSKEIQRLERAAQSISNKLNNPQFLEKAPDSVIQKEKEKLAEIEEELSKNQSSLNIYKD
ncbi:MAG: valine--tRNA ligase [Brevinemataceae bacterium]